jgi:hypothetical protein
VTCIFPRERSAQSSVDNCFRDQAVTNARQLADLRAAQMCLSLRRVASAQRFAVSRQSAASPIVTVSTD